jgi:hypothetical protein
MTAIQKTMHFASERKRAMDLAAAAGRFLADPEGFRDAAELRDLADRTLQCAFKVIDFTNNQIEQLKEEMT